MNSTPSSWPLLRNTEAFGLTRRRRRPRGAWAPDRGTTGRGLVDTGPRSVLSRAGIGWGGGTSRRRIPRGASAQRAVPGRGAPRRGIWYGRTGRATTSRRDPFPAGPGCRPVEPKSVFPWLRAGAAASRLSTTPGALYALAASRPLNRMASRRHRACRIQLLASFPPHDEQWDAGSSPVLRLVTCVYLKKWLVRHHLAELLLFNRQVVR